jgi:hypothetical protein
MLRRLARNSTSKASPSNGTAPTVPSRTNVHRHAEPPRLDQDDAGERGGDEVADTRHEADDRLDAEAHVGAGKE